MILNDFTKDLIFKVIYLINPKHCEFDILTFKRLGVKDNDALS